MVGVMNKYGFFLFMGLFLLVPATTYAGDTAASQSASTNDAASVADIQPIDTIASIDVSGNKAVEVDAILERMRTKVGDKLDRKLISRDVRKLYATGFFKDISVAGAVRSDGRHLTIHVVENPVIASIEYDGLKSVKEKDLKMRMKLKPGHIFNTPELQADINTLRKGYLKKGYYQVDVQPVQKLRDDGRVDLTMKIYEGDVTRIKRIHFIGNEAFDSDTLAGVIASRTADLPAWFSDRDVFDRKRLDADQQIMMQHYMNKGYLDAKVESTLLQLSPDRQWFYVTFSIHEGPQYQVSSIEITGDMVPDRETLLPLLQLQAGDTYSLEKLRDSITDITTRVGDEGYAFATVTPEFERFPDQKRVNLKLNIEKGREVYVERIEISGNTKTEDNVVRREMRQLEGSRFSSSNLEESKKRIGRLGYFDDVRISMPRGTAPDKVDLKLGVSEKSTGSWSFGVGYSQLEKVFFRSTIKQNNFLGKGYSTNLSGDLGAKTQNFSASVTDPYFMGEDFSASINGFKRQTTLQSLNSYKENSFGGGVGFGLPITDNLTYNLSYQYTQTNIFDVLPGASRLLLNQIGKQSTGELSNSLTWDSRDSAINARSGSVMSGGTSIAGLGGTNRFYTASVEARSYFDLGNDFILNPGTRAAYIKGYNRKAVPINRRLSLGGIGTVRGFDSSGITIRDPLTNDILGGNKSASASLNLFFPLPYIRTSGFRGVAFFDAGDVADFNQMLSFGRTRLTTGFGMEWLSPIGPLGLSWGIVLRDRQGDVRRNFEFALGQTF
ncbi:MAG: outer membrane protein assembly factor BamA [Zetaproteobacteria bacterium CG06_land_8_20_14_3_00_59_53]|nr:MAG: outer membrane protein assembly factor BamA [Zetaproteobacteria bacterium CG2_30_59_37]PIO90435.1 MAG: outer membrane protein assembly factor BamA [Zetaproteobacteria bacterium CG23_combo_of_CG06-09_8_20_14_all_59_86]PIQ65906.1 MAG: outer membrane protein assembly factor BamA [Zetaproteobacteria bacterium CG11_big_fil_rev_8_21_14_0_20_59_439]PIU71386.1 MAG: outer membrane protein assembly factor BamA [Zetaproteobacteria bacterium CG06_land_8_20_14_3_00_59_53]PIU97642.1 MAG: outer membra